MTSVIFTLCIVAVSRWVLVVLIFLDVFWFYPPWISFRGPPGWTRVPALCFTPTACGSSLSSLPLLTQQNSSQSPSPYIYDSGFMQATQHGMLSKSSPTCFMVHRTPVRKLFIDSAQPHSPITTLSVCLYHAWRICFSNVYRITIHAGYTSVSWLGLDSLCGCLPSYLLGYCNHE